MAVRHEEDEEEKEVEEDVVEDKVKLKLFLNTQHDILEDLDDCGNRKKNGSVDEVRQFLKQYPRCSHTLDFQSLSLQKIWKINTMYLQLGQMIQAAKKNGQKQQLWSREKI
jgi:hypothetical protein